MAIEIIPKPVEKIPFWQNFLFYFSVILLIISISSYFGFGYLLDKNKVIFEGLEETLKREKTPEESALEDKVLGYQKKINTFSQLISEHFYGSEVFSLIEKLCHPQVWFSQFGFNFPEYSLMLSGNSDSFSVVGQQLLLFEKESLIKEVNLSQLNLGKEGKIDFIINLSLDPTIFKK